MDVAWEWGILFGFATLITGIPGTLATQANAHNAYRQMLCYVGFTPIPLLVWTIAWSNMTVPPDNIRRSISICIGAVAGAVILFAVTEIWHKRAEAQSAVPNIPVPSSPTNPPPPIIAPNNSGIIAPNNSGSINLNQTPQRLQFTPALGQELLAKIPRDQPIIVTGVGSQSDRAVASQIAEFLRENKYTVQINGVGVMSPPPDHPLIWDARSRNLIVAPSAH